MVGRDDRVAVVDKTAGDGVGVISIRNIVYDDALRRTSGRGHVDAHCMSTVPETKRVDASIVC